MEDADLAGALLVHGGRLSAARRAFPHAPEPWLDLSTGISPHAYPLPRLASDDWTRLPDRDALAKFEVAMATAFGVDDPARVVAVSGSEAGLRLLPLLRGSARVGIAGPTYGSHLDAWDDAVEAPWVDLVADLAGFDIIVAVRPNNPTGAAIDADTLFAVADALSARGGWLVLDEAFADAMSGSSLAADPRADSAVILRSFGKFYGLAGVRLGAVIAPLPIAARLRHTLGDWPISYPAIRIGTAAYADTRWADNARARLRSDAARLDALLARHGWGASGGCPLFRLIEDHRAPGLHAALARAGILTRAFAYRADWLRIGLPGAQVEWSRLDTALRSFA